MKTKVLLKGLNVNPNTFYQYIKRGLIKTNQKPGHGYRYDWNKEEIIKIVRFYALMKAGYRIPIASKRAFEERNFPQNR